jgi:NAD(P)-dependent dehydrogenase (short-subunit alcohol dehydrogenase family)
MAEDLAGKVALVTGGGTGIGAAITAELADAGALVVICQPDQDEARAAAERLSQAERSVSGIGADLRSGPACRAVVEHVINQHGRIDVLVNNAAVTGMAALGAFLSFEDEQLDNIIDLNLKAVFHCSRRAAVDMAERQYGVIVNLASVGAYAAQPNAAAYVASKAGVVGLTRSLAFELAPLGVRVVAVAPGDIDISLSPGATATTRSKGDTWQRATPLGRRGRPGDVATAVRFLCSGRAGFITGTTLVVDGGWLTY